MNTRINNNPISIFKRNIKPQFKTILFHILFWIGIWFFYVYFFSYNSSNKIYVIWFSSFLLPVTIATAYIFIYYLIDKFLLRQKYFRFALYSLYTLVISTYFIVLTILGTFVFLTDLKMSEMPLMSRNYIFVLILVYLTVAIISFVYVINHSLKTSAKNKELKNKILETQLLNKEQELKYLKRQIHPHFLFNTLNTIYGMSLSNSTKTPEVILKLSNLLDYILYHAQKPKVRLIDEIEHIREYIELEKMRFEDTLKISFEQKNINKELNIAPMLFLPFIENAFKHGNIFDGYLTIKIHFYQNSNALNFNIKNTNKKNFKQSDSKGLGLENIKKRLNFNYKNNYELKIVDENNWFSVKLKIFNNG